MGSGIAFVTNEEGVSVLHVMETANEKEVKLPKLPTGVIVSMDWHKNGQDLGFAMTNARSPSDCYSVDVASGKAGAMDGERDAR